MCSATGVLGQAPDPRKAQQSAGTAQDVFAEPHAQQVTSPYDELKISPSSQGNRETFGTAVASDGDHMIVGATTRGPGSTRPGVAFVYHRTESGWNEEALLTPSDGQNDDRFGDAVALSGDYAAVGAYYETTLGEEAGAVYMYRRTADGWVEDAKLTASDGHAGAHFGYSLALAGEYLVVGAPRDSTRGVRAGAAYVYHRTATGWAEEGKLVTPGNDLANFNGFGRSVSISGKRMLVGVPGRGIAYVYVKTVQGWVQENALVRPSDERGDFFGNAVAIAGNYAVVGAPGSDVGAYDAGAAYIYEYTGGQWQYAKLVRDAFGTVEAYLGNAVAITASGYAIVGAPRQSSILDYAGAVYVYHRGRVGWSLEEQLMPSDVGRHHEFGWYLAFGGDDLIVASPGANTFVTGRGVVYTYKVSVDGNSIPWAEDVAAETSEGVALSLALRGTDVDSERLNYRVVQAPRYGTLSLSGGSITYTPNAGYIGVDTLTYRASDGVLDSNEATVMITVWPTPTLSFETTRLESDFGAGDEYLGSAVALSGNYAIVGAQNGGGRFSSAGVSYVYHRTPSGWGKQARLTGSESGGSDDFGASVAISSAYAVVGAPGHSRPLNAAGAAYVYERTGTVWTEVAKLTHADIQVGDDFGLAVALSGDCAVVGAPYANVFGDNDGAAYVYCRTAEGWTQEARLTPADALSGMKFGGAVALMGDLAIVGADEELTLGSDAGAAYVFRRTEVGWVEEAKLLASDGGEGAFFGQSVAIGDGYIVVGAMRQDRTGAAYVFRKTESGWMQDAKLTALDGAAWDRFGTAVAASGAYVLVGARLEDSITRTNTGAAYIYRAAESGWVAEGKLRDTVGSANAQFGTAVALDGAHAFIGAPNADARYDNVGYAYAYRLIGINTPPQVESLETQTYADVPVTIPLTGTDVDNDALSYRVIQAPTQGQVTIQGGNAIYTPHPGRLGADAFTYVANDGQADAPAAVVTLTIRPAPSISWAERMLPPSPGEVGAELGSAIAIDGGYALVGGTGRVRANSVYAYRYGEHGWSEEERLSASDEYNSNTYDDFGKAVALAGEHAFVGAPGVDDVATDAGAAYVYRRTE